MPLSSYQFTEYIHVVEMCIERIGHQESNKNVTNMSSASTKMAKNSQTMCWAY